MLLIYILLTAVLCSVAAYRYSSKSATEHAKQSIPPVDDSFEWEKAEPLYLRPFEGKKNFRPSMGIRNISDQREDLFLIESTYLESVKRRQLHLAEYESKLLFCFENPRAVAAVREYYETAMDFLCQRYPRYFHEEEKGIRNKITQELLPKNGDDHSPEDLLKLLLCNMEEDLVLLLKDNPNDPEEEYILRASINGSPAGFDPSHGYNTPISSIHKPVPQYKDRLSSPMHRFFNKLKPSDMWIRGNWSVQTNNVIFKLEDHHARPGEKLQKLQVSDIDFENGCFMRCERQVLTRLPKSRAVIMVVRTYLIPVKKLKADGYGEELATAIESLPEDLAFYKRRQLWGDAVKEYLLS